MITRRLLRPASARAKTSWTCPSCTTSAFVTRNDQSRSLHSVPPLSHDEFFTEKGVPGLLSVTGYQIAWTQYQKFLVNKLNGITAGEPYEHQNVKDIVLRFARDPLNAALFNFASAAHNNHTFFLGFAPKPLKLEECAHDIKSSLEKDFGSIETLRETFINTAASMFGPGFVWLVWAKHPGTSASPTYTAGRDGNWRILTTYLAGTPYPEAGYRRQGLDMANNNAASRQAFYESQEASNAVGAFGPYSAMGRAQRKVPPGGTTVMPVLCVNTWEHCYLYDYGVDGKSMYLRDWWAAIDWGVVEQNAPLEAKRSSHI